MKGRTWALFAVQGCILRLHAMHKITKICFSIIGEITGIQAFNNCSSTQVSAIPCSHTGLPSRKPFCQCCEPELTISIRSWFLKNKNMSAQATPTVANVNNNNNNHSSQSVLYCFHFLHWWFVFLSVCLSGKLS